MLAGGGASITANEAWGDAAPASPSGIQTAAKNTEEINIDDDDEEEENVEAGSAGGGVEGVGAMPGSKSLPSFATTRGAHAVFLGTGAAAPSKLRSKGLGGLGFGVWGQGLGTGAAAPSKLKSC
jgi:hypothetical protein